MPCTNIEMENRKLLNEPEITPAGLKRPSGYAWTWLNLIFTILLLGIGLWYLMGRTTIKEIVAALASANPLPVMLSVITILLILLLKAWRWQLMFVPRRQAPAYHASFWALLLGAYVNILLPIFRLGEIARIFALESLAAIPKTKALATLVMEKSVDMVMLGLMVAVLLTAVFLPDSLNFPTTTSLVGVLALLLLLFLYLVAVYTEQAIQLLQMIFSRLPEKIERRLSRWSVSGLTGLAALRSRRLSLLLLALSLLIAGLSMLTPWLLFSAFHLPLGWREAMLIHVAVTIALAPPTTPVKIGIFDGVVAFFLLQFGVQDEATIISYTILYHLIAVLPLIILGAVAATRAQWRWSYARRARSLPTQTTNSPD